MPARLPVRRVRVGLLSGAAAMAARQKRTYRAFQHREAAFRICCARFDAVTTEIVRQRDILEQYIGRHRAFGSSFEPLEVLSDAPEVARRMARAAALVGVGPMAAVAGAMAQCAAEAGLAVGAREVIVDNGGDVYLKTVEPVVVGLYAGSAALADKLAFSLQPDDTPIAVCSSSGKMGHSMSLGRCDLATVVAQDAALADAAATQAANLVKTPDDVNAALNRIAAIEGITGVLIVKDDQIGLAGHLPPLVRTRRQTGQDLQVRDLSRRHADPAFRQLLRLSGREDITAAPPRHHIKRIPGRSVETGKGG